MSRRRACGSRSRPEWLDRAYAERDASLSILKVYRPFDPLRDDPWSDALLKRMGFEE